MAQRREREEPPVCSAAETGPVCRGGVADEGVAEHAERADGAEELVAHFPEGRPLAAEELGARRVAFGATGRKVDQEDGDAHEGLRYGISCEHGQLGFVGGEREVEEHTDEDKRESDAACSDSLLDWERHCYLGECLWCRVWVVDRA